jgi:hypothetical protein
VSTPRTTPHVGHGRAKHGAGYGYPAHSSPEDQRQEPARLAELVA